MIKESVLIQMFRDIHVTFEKTLALTHLTKRHGEPNMTATYEALQRYHADEKTYQIVPGRKSKHRLPNVIDQGLERLWKADGDEEGSGEVGDVTLEDVAVEIGL